MFRSWGQKGYARIRTSLGDLNVEIHCDMVPRAAENFLGLCRDGRYDETLVPIASSGTSSRRAGTRRGRAGAAIRYGARPSPTSSIQG